MRQPGCNAKYLTYSLWIRAQTNLENFTSQVTEAGNSNRMEKMGFEKALKSLKDEVVDMSR